MRLLSIFSLLFLISLLLHSGAEKRTQPETLAAREDQADQEETQTLPETEETRENFSALIFKPPYPIGHFEFEREYNFSIIELELKNLIVGGMDDRFKNENHFCAVGYVFPQARKNGKNASPRKEVAVYWREGKILYRWTGGDPKAAKEDFYFARSLLFSPGISLDNHSAEDKGQPLEESSATFRENVENLLVDCERHGRQYTIAPFAPPPRGFNTPQAPARPARAAPSAPPVSAPPVSAPPVSEPPVSTPPVSTPPVSTPPVSAPPVSTPPVSAPPVPEQPAPEPALGLMVFGSGIA
jgi:hypothetical protein